MSFQVSESQIEAAYKLAHERYSAFGVDTSVAMETLKSVPISLHCWQGDDVAGFEDPDRGLSGGIMATGNYPGKARNIDELRSDLGHSLQFDTGSASAGAARLLPGCRAAHPAR